MASDKQNDKKKYTSSTGMQVVDLVEQGEQTEYTKKSVFDWEEFWHLFFGWLISALVIIVVLFVLTMAERSKDLLRDVWSSVKKMYKLNMSLFVLYPANSTAFFSREE